MHHFSPRAQQWRRGRCILTLKSAPSCFIHWNHWRKVLTGSQRHSCDSPVEVFLDHFGDSSGHGSLLRGEVLVEVDAQLLLQEVHDELGPRRLLVVVLHPGHLTLRRQLPIEVVLQRQSALCEILQHLLHVIEENNRKRFPRVTDMCVEIPQRSPSEIFYMVKSV